MARTKKTEDEEEKTAKKGVKYSDVKPEAGLKINRNEYLAFLDIYHEIRPYLEREPTVTKEYLLKKYPKRKKMIEDVWICVFDLKLKYPHEMIGRILTE